MVKSEWAEEARRRSGVDCEGLGGWRWGADVEVYLGGPPHENDELRNTSALRRVPLASCCFGDADPRRLGEDLPSNRLGDILASEGRESAMLSRVDENVLFLYFKWGGHPQNIRHRLSSGPFRLKLAQHRRRGTLTREVLDPFPAKMSIYGNSAILLL
jgi:hypothetical protein